MKSSSLVSLVLPYFALAAVLDQRQACYDDDCLMQVSRGPPPEVRSTDCVNFLTTTILIDPIIVATATRTEVVPVVGCETPGTSMPAPSSTLEPASSTATTATVGPILVTTGGTIPPYATDECSIGAYRSACSCVGVVPTGPTQIAFVSPLITTTVTTTSTTRVGACPTVTSICPNSTSSTITMSHNSTTSTTVITISTPDATGTGTAPISSTATISSTPSPTPTGCIGGVNFVACGINSTDCSNLGTDVSNCGACGNVCPSGNTCTNGVCTRPPCDSRCGFLRACGPVESSCICGSDVDDNGICFNGDGFCRDFETCSDTEDCPLGSVCVTSTCCNTGTETGLCLNTASCVGTLSSELSRPFGRPESGGANIDGILRLSGAFA